MAGDDRINDVRRKVEAMLEDLGWSKTDLFSRSTVASSTYYDMWESSSVRVLDLLKMAEAMGCPASSLLPDRHRGEALKSLPDARPFVEDRIEQLERKVRQLETQLKKR